MDFKTYLQKKQYAHTTIAIYIKQINESLAWFSKENITPENAEYRDILSYIRHMQNKGLSKRYINHRLTVLRHYYNYLIKVKKAKDNIAADIFLKGINRRIPHNLLNDEQLVQIYENYPTSGIIGKRNKIILGLLVFQGLSTGDILNIEQEDIKLREGKIYIHAKRRKNSRILPLVATQVMEIHEYIETVRPAILAVHEATANSFFVTIHGKGNMNMFTNLTAHIKKYIPEFTAISQIRISVITSWLQRFNLREVQYMAGHKYVSSTERYLLTSLDDLKSDLNEYHPL
ncbi:MAG: tyrosine-type recombinase/integrase [Bacteroidota bacterium]